MTPSTYSLSHNADAYLTFGANRLRIVDLSVSIDVERVRSERAVLPDLFWETADPAGHWHRWVDGTLPTCRKGSRHVPCDGSCGGICEGEGYDVTEWRCLQCDAVIEPGYVPDEQARGPGIPISQTLDYEITVAPSWETVASIAAAGSVTDAQIEYEAGSALPVIGAQIEYEVGDVKHVVPMPRLYPGDVTFSSDSNRLVLHGQQVQAVSR